MKRIPNLNPIQSAKAVNEKIVVVLTDGEEMTLFEAGIVEPDELIGLDIFEAGSLYFHRQMSSQAVFA
jgi:hypothetical protein